MKFTSSTEDMKCHHGQGSCLWGSLLTIAQIRGSHSQDRKIKIFNASALGSLNLPILINFLFESQRPSETAFESLSAPVAVHQVPVITFPCVVKTLLSCQVQPEKEFYHYIEQATFFYRIQDLDPRSPGVPGIWSMGPMSVHTSKKRITSADSVFQSNQICGKVRKFSRQNCINYQNHKNLVSRGIFVENILCLIFFNKKVKQWLNINRGNDSQ